MSRSTVAYPALLGHGGRFAREVARMDAQVRCAGLFDQYLAVDGFDGHTQVEMEAIRAFYLLGEAFGLTSQALEEWHRLCTYDRIPLLEGPLVREHRPVLPDLLLRVQTLALYKDRDGRGAVYMRTWRRARRLRELLDARVRLEAEVRAYAPHLGVYAQTLQDSFASQPMAGLRELRRAWLAAELTAAGWRWLLRNSPADMPYSGDRFSALGWAITLGNVFGELGPAFAPDGMFSRYVGQFEEEARHHEWTLQGKAWLVNSAWRHYQRVEGLEDREHFMVSVFRQVASWVFLAGWTPDANQRRVGWPAIERAWRRDTGQVPGPFMRWDARFECVEWAGLVAVPIDNSHDLWAEGAAMGHCIADYIERCISGTFVAISVRGPGGERVATMSFEHSGGQRWDGGECKARFNRDVTDERMYALMGRVRGVLERLDAGNIAEANLNPRS